MTATNSLRLMLLLLICLPAVQVVAQESHAGHDAPATEHAHADHAASRAFPDLGGTDMNAHMSDDSIYSMVLLDRLELQSAEGVTPFVWDARAWVGTDRNRLHLRSEGEVAEGTVERASLEAFWVRPVARWWNLAVGLRQDLKPESSRSWLAVGAVGLAPYRANVQATAYLGEGGRTALRFEAEYDLLLTNRLILQPRLEMNAYGKDDTARGVGSGLASAEAGLRLRYEIRREVAPYAGIVWIRSFGGTADLARAAGRDDRELRAIAGVRLWF